MDPVLPFLLLLLLEAPILISAVTNYNNPSPVFSISLSPLTSPSPSPSPFSSPTSPSGSAANANAMPLLSPGFQVGGDKHGIDSHQKLLISLIVACSLLVFILSLLLCIWVYQKMFSGKSTCCGRSDVEKGVPLAPFLSKLSSSAGAVSGKNVSFFDHKTLDRATNSFKESNILGEGGFGCVYKAKLEDNHQIAVKKLDCPSQDAEREFENEVHLLSRMHHSNIISLLGYSINGDTKFIIYELMQNGSLETQLHGPSRGSELTWHMRMKIALDTARSAPGLEYLHEHCNPPVIHRDLKSSNILLDAEFNAKLSDFGLAVTDGSQNKNDFKLSGTLGYVAPEYMLHGKLTDKSDVYAFGVVLLELLLGRKPVPTQCQSIVKWAMPQLTDRSKLPNIVDATIKDTMDLKHLYQVAAVAALCVQPEPSYRPLITDVMHSLVPLVPVQLGGTLRATQPPIPRDG